MEWSLHGTSGSQDEWQEAGGAGTWLRRMGGFNREMVGRCVLLKGLLGQREHMTSRREALGEDIAEVPVLEGGPVGGEKAEKSRGEGKHGGRGDSKGN